MSLKTRNFLYTEDIFIVIYLLRNKFGKFCPKDISLFSLFTNFIIRLRHILYCHISFVNKVKVKIII